MRLDKDGLFSISMEAKQSPRKRVARDLRNTVNDYSQRMLNAIEPETELPIHRHRKTTETCIVLYGSAEEIFYDDNGNETERVVMKPDSDCCGVNIELGRWHKIVSLEPNTIIIEAKDGKYEPLTSEDILNV